MSNGSNSENIELMEVQLNAPASVVPESENVDSLGKKLNDLMEAHEDCGFVYFETAKENKILHKKVLEQANEILALTSKLSFLQKIDEFGESTDQKLKLQVYTLTKETQRLRQGRDASRHKAETSRKSLEAKTQECKKWQKIATKEKWQAKPGLSPDDSKGQESFFQNSRELSADDGDHCLKEIFRLEASVKDQMRINQILSTNLQAEMSKNSNLTAELNNEKAKHASMATESQDSKSEIVKLQADLDKCKSEANHCQIELTKYKIKCEQLEKQLNADKSFYDKSLTDFQRMVDQQHKNFVRVNDAWQACENSIKQGSEQTILSPKKAKLNDTKTIDFLKKANEQQKSDLDKAMASLENERQASKRLRNDNNSLVCHRKSLESACHRLQANSVACFSHSRRDLKLTRDSLTVFKSAFISEMSDFTKKWDFYASVSHSRLATLYNTEDSMLSGFTEILNKITAAEKQFETQAVELQYLKSLKDTAEIEAARFTSKEVQTENSMPWDDTSTPPVYATTPTALDEFERRNELQYHREQTIAKQIDCQRLSSQIVELENQLVDAALEIARLKSHVEDANAHHETLRQIEDIVRKKKC